MWVSTVTPNLTVQDNAGMCLRFTQSVWGAPVKYKSAWDSWLATPDKQSGDHPEVSCLIWFEHWGTYGTYGNWGHVVTFVPGRGYLSSPTSGYGQQWFDSIRSVERAFNAKYVGWSPSINGLVVAKYVTGPKPVTESVDMIVKVQCVDGFAAVWNMNTNAYQHIDDPNEWTYWTEHLEEYMFESEDHFNIIRKKYAKVFGG